jgi:P-type Cu2+ transporter
MSLAEPLAEIKPEEPQIDAAAAIILSLPTIHCAGCISAVERGLQKQPGVSAARVNLSLKRVAIEAEASVTAAAMVSALAGIGYEAHELDSDLLAEATTDKTGRGLLLRLAVAGFATMNVMLLSVSVWAGAEAATRDLMHWISAVIALPAIGYAAQPFFTNALSALRARRLNMDVPISLAILLTVGMSLYETSLSGEYAYFDAALMLTFFLLAGRYLDHRTRAQARSAAQELAALEVPRALKLVAGQEVLVPVGELVPGDTIVVKPGTRVPVDGLVTGGESEIDRAFLTGESLPAYVGPQSHLSAGEINLTGPLTLKVTARAEESTLQKMAALVALAESSRNKYTSLADQAAALYAPGVHILSLIAFVGWVYFTGDIRLSLNIAVAILIITCPCALGLAVPAVTTAASGRLYRKGVLLKSSTALERLAEVDHVVFDKTGTLTLGQPKLEAADGLPRETLQLAAALARHSVHPLARAVVAAAGDRGLTGDLPEITDIREVPGHGVEGVLDGETVRLGRADWLGAAATGGTASYLKQGDGPVMALRFTDEIRPGVKDLIIRLRALGPGVSLITGDTEAAARGIAAQLGIDDVTANALPEDKVRIIGALDKAGRKVLMVGDGLNDTGALSAAHVSLSPASAIDVARVASDIVILGQDFSVLAECVKTARSARARIKENFTLASVYNLIAVPVAFAGFATPLIAALAMSTSSITVTLNAWRLR